MLFVKMTVCWTVPGAVSLASLVSSQKRAQRSPRWRMGEAVNGVVQKIYGNCKGIAMCSVSTSSNKECSSVATVK